MISIYFRLGLGLVGARESQVALTIETRRVSKTRERRIMAVVAHASANLI